MTAEPLRLDQVPSGCWVACIAGITGLPHDELAALVPQEMAEAMQRGEDIDRRWTDYHNAVNQYTRERGWRIAYTGSDAPKGFAIGIGKSQRGLDHAVIVHDGTLWHDPHPSRAGVLALLSYEVLVPIVGMGA